MASDPSTRIPAGRAPIRGPRCPSCEPDRRVPVLLDRGRDCKAICGSVPSPRGAKCHSGPSSLRVSPPPCPSPLKGEGCRGGVGRGASFGLSAEGGACAGGGCFSPSLGGGAVFPPCWGGNLGGELAGGSNGRRRRRCASASVTA